MAVPGHPCALGMRCPRSFLAQLPVEHAPTGPLAAVVLVSARPARWAHTPQQGPATARAARSTRTWTGCTLVLCRTASHVQLERRAGCLPPRRYPRAYHASEGRTRGTGCARIVGLAGTIPSREPQSAKFALQGSFQTCKTPPCARRARLAVSRQVTGYPHVRRARQELSRPPAPQPHASPARLGCTRPPREHPSVWNASAGRTVQKTQPLHVYRAAPASSHPASGGACATSVRLDLRTMPRGSLNAGFAGTGHTLAQDLPRYNWSNQGFQS